MSANKLEPEDPRNDDVAAESNPGEPTDAGVSEASVLDSDAADPSSEGVDPGWMHDGRADEEPIDAVIVDDEVYSPADTANTVPVDPVTTEPLPPASVTPEPVTPDPLAAEHPAADTVVVEPAAGERLDEQPTVVAPAQPEVRTVYVEAPVPPRAR